jgi:hypothetical protein
MMLVLLGVLMETWREEECNIVLGKLLIRHNVYFLKGPAG